MRDNVPLRVLVTVAAGVDLVLAFHADYGKPGCARGTVHMVEHAGACWTEVRIFRE